MLVRPLSCVLATTAVLGGVAAAEQPLFPFVVSYDAPQNVTDVSGWLERPAGRHGFVRAEKGRLATDAGPIRFWATNLCFEACFPSHEQAEQLAARLARLGINCVRMHHMDMHSIWGNSPNKLTIDPEKLERLDYLVYQLKLHGIYTNLNLHVSRTLSRAEGLEEGPGRPQFDKGLGNFEPRMIEAQKKYARDLLTHVNPHTKNAYADEPAVAMVEISNEDALFAVWGWGQLDRLPEPYATTYRKLWNAWLKQKYGSTERLRKAWNLGAVPLGEELLENGDFSKPLDQTWNVERDDQTEVAWSVEPASADQRQGAPLPGPPRRCLRIVVARQGRVSWHPQLWQAGFAVEKDRPYTLTFSMRSDRKRSVAINCMMAHEPWQRLGLSRSVDVDTRWEQYRVGFVAERADDGARITLSNLTPGTYDLADVSLRPGGIVGLALGQGLEDDSVPVLERGGSGTTAAARHDFVDFLWDTERDYWSGMYRFLKDELGVQPPVSGTQLSYSPVHVQAGLDYIDAHSYWKHPHFPGRPWDRRNWEMHNVALVNDPPGTLGGLAARRVEGMAFTVSEYNHPAPNVYRAEGFPMIAAVGAFQAWDGVFHFAYSHNDDFRPRRVGSFFDSKADPCRMVHMPACAAMFLRGDVQPARQTCRAAVSREAERAKLYETLSAWRLTANDFGVDPHVSVIHRIGMDLGPDAQAATHVLEESEQHLLSDTGELMWGVPQPGAGYFIVNTPRTKLFTGFVGGRTFELGDVRLKIGRTRLDWATVSMVSIDGQGFHQPGRILIAATGWVQNSGAELEELPGDRVTLRDRWGSEPVLCEGVPAEIVLPAAAERVSLYPLDESGNRRAALPGSAPGARTVLQLKPEHKTLWYEVQIHDE